MMDPLWSETRWSTFKYFLILIVTTNYISVRKLDHNLFISSLVYLVTTNTSFCVTDWAIRYILAFQKLDWNSPFAHPNECAAHAGVMNVLHMLV